MKNENIKDEKKVLKKIKIKKDLENKLQTEAEISKTEEDKLNKARNDLQKDVKSILKKNEQISFLLVGKNKNLKLVLVDSVSGRVSKKIKSIDKILNKTLIESENGIIVLQKGRSKFASMVLLDPKTLEINKKGNEEISVDSMLVSDKEGFIYAIANSNSKWILKKYDSNFSEIAKSKEIANPKSIIKFKDDKVLFEGENGKVIILNKKDLR